MRKSCESCEEIPCMEFLSLEYDSSVFLCKKFSGVEPCLYVLFPKPRNICRRNMALELIIESSKMNLIFYVPSHIGAGLAQAV
jgi:hypothetical protein